MFPVFVCLFLQKQAYANAENYLPCFMSCFFLLNIISWGISLLVQKGIPHSFFCDITKEYSIVRMYHSLFNRSLTDEHFCCFLSFAATEVIQCITLHLYCLIFGEMQLHGIFRGHYCRNIPSDSDTQTGLSIVTQCIL